MDNAETLLQLSAIIEAQNQIIKRQELELLQLRTIEREERGDRNGALDP